MKFFLGLLLIALIGWAFIPRTTHYSENMFIYPVEVKYCNPNSICDVDRFLAPIKIRVDTIHSRIVWMDTETESIGVWAQCDMIDKNNWKCWKPYKNMVGGYLESSETNLHYMSGYSYRLHWITRLRTH